MNGIVLFTSLTLLSPGLGQWYEHISAGFWENAADVAMLQYSADSTDAEAAAALTIALTFDNTMGTDQLTAFAESPFDSLSSLSWAALGFLSMQEGSMPEAERSLMTSVELDPSSALGWYFMGMLREDQNDSISAIACYEISSSLDENFIPAGINHARLLQQSGRTDEAVEIFESIMNPESPAGMLAFAEYLLLKQPAGTDSLERNLLEHDPRAWLNLARDRMESRPDAALAAALRAELTLDETLLGDFAGLLLDLGEYELAASAATEALAASIDSNTVLEVLGEALFEMGDHSGSHEAFQTALDKNPFSSNALNFLGRISEQYARTGDAVDYYLMSLELNPFDVMARERIRMIAGDSYDPYAYAESLRGLSAYASLDLSMEQGNRSMLEYGGSASVSYLFNRRGTSIEAGLGGRTISWEEDHGPRTDTLNTETGWASAVFSYWFDDSYYLEASSYWDRQRYTVRPWQISSHLAGGWQKHVSNWMWFSPELGIGSVNARWISHDEKQYSNSITVYASAGLWYHKPYTFIRDAQLSGSIHFPPDDPENFISSGEFYIALRTWSPLFVSLGYSVDYTRRPEVLSWNKFNTSFSVSVNFDLI